MKAKVVIGLQFGDEGKGLVTNYLCSKPFIKPLVVRFSGGHQAGHTVIHKGTRHVFSNFGAGTLQDAPTYWSEHCTFEPVGFLKERTELSKKVEIYSIRYYLNKLSPITTPYDILANQLHENKYNHGSVGVGYGKTIERNEKLKFVAGDILHLKVAFMKLDFVRKYYGLNRVNEKEFIQSLIEINKKIKGGLIELVESLPEILENTYYVFEGSQGLLLDQDYGFFPYVTRGNVGTKRFKQFNIPNFEKWYVTRAYQTRHGNGPMTNTEHDLFLINNKKETNILDKYQGEFRTTPLDLDLLKYSLECDRNVEMNYSDADENLVITCVDQIKDGEFIYTYNKNLYKCELNRFISIISDVLKFKKENIFLGVSPESSLAQCKYIIEPHEVMN